MARSAVEEWYYKLPIVSRVWFTSAVLSGLATRFGLLKNPWLLAFGAQGMSVFSDFHVWRLVTNFIFFGTTSFNWMMMMFMLSQYAPHVENNCYPSGGGPHQGNSADFMYMLMVGGGVLLLASYFFALPFMSFSLFFMILYIWARRNPTAKASYFFLPPFPAIYLPWVMMAVNCLMGGDFLGDALGIAAGHLYYFVMEELPNLEGPFKNRALIQTPDWLYSLFRLPRTDAAAAVMRERDRRAAVQGGGAAAAGGAARPGGGAGPARPAGHTWGTGRVLGVNGAAGTGVQ